MFIRYNARLKINIKRILVKPREKYTIRRKMIKSVFNQNDVTEVIERINKLNSESQRQWGKMSIDQMLAHLNVTYEMVYTDKHPKPNPFMRLIIKLVAKNAVVGEKPYKKDAQTAPQFIIADKRDFELEKKRLIDFIVKTQELGAEHFDGKESLSFGVLNITEWNSLFYKHLDHHLNQFGV